MGFCFLIYRWHLSGVKARASEGTKCLSGRYISEIKKESEATLCQNENGRIKVGRATNTKGSFSYYDFDALRFVVSFASEVDRPDNFRVFFLLFFYLCLLL